MRELQARIIAEMGIRPTIDPAHEVERRVTFLGDYVSSTHTGGFVLGISGGLDSTLAGRLAQLAVDRLRNDGTEADFIAVRLPYGTQADADDARAAMDFVAARTAVTLNIAGGVDGLPVAARADRVLADHNRSAAGSGAVLSRRLRLGAHAALALTIRQ